MLFRTRKRASRGSHSARPDKCRPGSSGAIPWQWRCSKYLENVFVWVLDGHVPFAAYLVYIASLRTRTKFSPGSNYRRGFIWLRMPLISNTQPCRFHPRRRVLRQLLLPSQPFARYRMAIQIPNAMCKLPRSRSRTRHGQVLCRAQEAPDMCVRSYSRAFILLKLTRSAGP